MQHKTEPFGYRCCLWQSIRLDSDIRSRLAKLCKLECETCINMGCMQSLVFSYVCRCIEVISEDTQTEMTSLDVIALLRDWKVSLLIAAGAFGRGMPGADQNLC